MNLKNAPQTAGVYFLKRNREVLYVGKALNLRERLKTHLTSRTTQGAKSAQMRAWVNNFSFIQVRSDFEALILEINQIKKYRPPFNIKLKDAKDYLYLKITAEQFPRVLSVRQRDLYGSLFYLGPFPQSVLLRHTLRSLRKIFPFCNEKKKTGKPCFYYQLGLCPGPCAGKINPKDYRKIIRQLIAVLNGKQDKLILNWEKEMEKYSHNQQFEEAAKLRDKISGVKYLLQENRIQDYLDKPDLLQDLMSEEVEGIQKIIGSEKEIRRIECYDISHISGTNMVGSMVVFTDGQPDRDQYRRFRIKTVKQVDDYASLQEVLERRFHNDWDPPDLLVIDGGKGQLNASIEIINKLGLQVPIISLAKREEEIFTQEGEKLRLKRTNPALRLIQRLRDEAHRFAITYHRKLRSMEFLAPTKVK